MLRLSIGIAAYNEEKNIGRTLRLILAQDLAALPVKLEEIIVVSDGSTDRTDEIVHKVAEEFPVVHLSRREKRSGKPAAMEHLLQMANSDVVALFDADAFLEPGCLKYLLEPFLSGPDVGGTSGRKIPYNAALMPVAFWEMCHYFNLAAPKLSGSVMALRNVVKSIPPMVATDDMYIQLELEKLGLKIIYVPRAIARTVEPDTIKGYFKQRKRIYRGYLQLLSEQRVRLPSAGVIVPLKALMGAIRAHPSRTFSFLLCSAMEVVIRLWALVEHRTHKPSPYMFERTRQ